MGRGPTWSSQDIDNLRFYVTAGYTSKEVGARLGRSQSAVLDKADKLGLEWACKFPFPPRRDGQMRREQWRAAHVKFLRPSA